MKKNFLYIFAESVSVGYFTKQHRIVDNKTRYCFQGRIFTERKTSSMSEVRFITEFLYVICYIVQAKWNH